MALVYATIFGGPPVLYLNFLFTLPSAELQWTVTLWPRQGGQTGSAVPADVSLARLLVEVRLVVTEDGEVCDGGNFSGRV